MYALAPRGFPWAPRLQVQAVRDCRNSLDFVVLGYAVKVAPGGAGFLLVIVFCDMIWCV